MIKAIRMTAVLVLILGIYSGAAYSSEVVNVAPVAEKQDRFFDWDLKGSLGKAEDDKFETYVPAVSGALLNETPHITTELRPMFWYHKIPKDSVVGNGNVYLIAAQARVALTKRLGLIATKDGYAWIKPDKALEHDSGFANLAFGLKYALLYNPEKKHILTTGVRYEAPTGSLELNKIRFQGTGKGLMDLFLTGEKRWGKFGLQGSFGWTIPFDTVRQSGLVHYHAHVDYELFSFFYPTFEYNGYTVANKGRERELDFEGGDVFNLGNNGGGTVNTFAPGFRVKFNEHVQWGAAYEFSVGRQDLTDYRLQTDLVISF